MRTDGSVIIDTRLDTSGFTKGAANMQKSLSGLGASVKKLGVVIGSVFAIKKVVNFGIASSKAAREVSDAFTGLQSILEGQGRSFSEAKAFIEEYISDGLVPAMNATTAYKNLASRGYDDKQIQQVLVALKDASAYGRQSSYSMGEAVQSATEGLKNENSVLVDNAGVTKNVAKMWEDYAASIGTTANNLTKQQKIQAEVTGILEESRFQTGDAARVAETLSGKLQQLSFNFNNLKVAVGNIVNPFVKAFLPVINTALTAVTKFANKVAEVVNAFFGTSMNGFESTATELATGYDNAATGADNLASSTDKATNATKKATKAANKYLSPLDQINRYSTNKTSDDTSTPSTSSGAGVSGTVSGGYDAIAKGNGVLDQATSKFSEFAEKIKGYMQPLIVQLERFGEIAKSAFTWFVNNVLAPLGKFTVNEVLPRFFQTLANVLDIANTVLIALKPLWMWFWENVLKPIAEFTGGVFLATWDLINAALEKFSAWLKNNPQDVQGFAVAIGAVIAVLNPIPTAIALVVTACGLLIKNWDKVKEKTKEVWGDIKNWLSNTLETMKKNIASNVEIIKKGFINGWNAIKSGATSIWNGLKSSLSSIWSGIKNTASNTWSGIKSTVTGVLNTIASTATSVGSTISNALKNAFEKAKEFIKKPINGIIGLLNSMISGLVAGVNLALGLLNKINVKIPDWIPVYGGRTFGFNFPKLTAPKIPYLATGAVIPPNAPFMAVLGDQKNGTNIETPEKLLRSIIREELGGRNNSSNNKYQFTAQINRRTLFEEMISEAMMRQASSGRNPFELA